MHGAGTAEKPTKLAELELVVGSAWVRGGH
jgi:hypothetical protein